MTDPNPTPQPPDVPPAAPTSADDERCPWCSAPVADAAATTCPSCGASLHEKVEGDVPGVTQIDAAKIATKSHLRTPGMRAFIGLTDEDTEGAPPGSHVGPPSDDVRKEMLRLKMAALEAELEARAAALAAERATQAAESGRPVAESSEATEPGSLPGEDDATS